LGKSAKPTAAVAVRKRGIPAELLSRKTGRSGLGLMRRPAEDQREARPRTVRELFALANQHMRRELNDLARRLDNQQAAAEL
jgi:hypothetical protein